MRRLRARKDGLKPAFCLETAQDEKARTMTSPTAQRPLISQNQANRPLQVTENKEAKKQEKSVESRVEAVRAAFQPSRPPVELAEPGQLKCDVKGCLLRAVRFPEDGDRHFCQPHADEWLARKTETPAQSSPSPFQSADSAGISHEELARRIAEAERRGRLEGLWGRVIHGDGNGTFNRADRVTVFSEAEGHYNPAERAAQEAEAARAEQEARDPWRLVSERERMQSIMASQLPDPPSPNENETEEIL